MLASIWQDVKREFSFGNMVTRIVIVNICVFVFINLVRIGIHVFSGWNNDSTLFNDILHFFCMSSSIVHDLTHPWVIITSIFLHESFWHIIWNMLFLYWFGRIVGDLIGDQHILPIYLLGGITGCLVFFASANLLPYGADATRFALGASAGVIAIVVAAGVISPDYFLRIPFIGDVKLKYIVMLLLFLDMVGIANMSNTGGHFAHLGGAIFGWFYVRQLREGKDYSEPINNMISRLSDFFSNFGSRMKGNPKKPTVAYRNPNRTAKKAGPSSDTYDYNHQDQIDAILDKIKRDGYESLSEEEKAFLFNASKK